MTAIRVQIVKLNLQTGDSGQVTLKVKDKLPYTNAVVHEVMRIKPVAPIGLPHTTTCDTTLGVYSTPVPS